jgi:hypothetical protein
MTFSITSSFLIAQWFTIIRFLSIQWYQTYGVSMLSNIFVSNLIPYLFLFIFDCKCCCGKATRSKKRVFKADENYIRRLTTIFVAFGFGFGMPILIVLCFIPFGLTLIIDELLVIYWLKPTVISSKMVRSFMN